jgi:enamine deaminase RidA (YjgF/YER057c/UK114 family)
MTPRRDGILTVTGRVGAQVDLDTARSAAALALGNALAAVGSVLPIGTAYRCVEMTVYIACAPDFTDLSQVADGATGMLVERFGTDALPARSAVGVYALPGGAPVEIALTAEVTPNPAHVG